MALKWTDFQTIAEMLYDENPEVDPTTLRMTELHALVMALDGFDDDPEASNEARLEAILQAWLEERE